MWRRLLTLLGLTEAPDLSWRREPFFGPSNVIDLDTERLRRMPVMLVGYVTQKQCTTSPY